MSYLATRVPRFVTPGPEMERTGHEPPGPISEALTAQEIHLLRLLAHGMPQAQVARELAISLATLKRYLGNIERKLGVDNRIQAIAVAIRRGLV